MKKINNFIIDITGSSGSGKTTLAKKLARKYNYSVIFSGLLFRYAAKEILEKNPRNRISFLKKIFSKINYKKLQRLNLHTPEISSFTSEIAKKLEIRKIIKKKQKQIVKKRKKVVLEGRDGSKIFPNADVKFYVVCSPIKIAAKRRFKQLKKKNKSITLSEVLKDLKKRDFMDRHRRFSRLERHAEAVYINTAKLDIGTAVAKMSKVVDKKLKNYGNRRKLK